MAVKAKFKVQRIERTIGSKGVFGDDGKMTYEPAEMATVVLSPIFHNGDPEHENTKFWQASPSGEIRLGTVNAAAVEQFTLGSEMYVTFEPAE